MTESRLIPSSARRLALPRRPNSHAQSNIRGRAEAAQSPAYWVDANQNHWWTWLFPAFKLKINAAVKVSHTANDALSP